MHPSVRGAAGERCSECGMALVPIPDRSDATFWLDVTAAPAAVPAGRPVRLRLAVRDRSSNDIVSRVDEMHERPLHLFVVSYDLSHFEHVHPQQMPGGEFEIALTLPKPGAYRLVADVLPTGATPQTLQHTVVTARSVSPLASRAGEPAAEVLEARGGGVRARLTPMRARMGDDAHLVLELEDAETGRPVDDLQPYLGAWGHVLMASTDLADIVHSHPLIEETTPGGPTITFHTLFARDGWYRVWTQVQRDDRVLTFVFTVRVAPVV